jgi:peptidoglycan/xylan/chitin deacetylase (PgdA/CDA1 family)
LNVLRWLPAAWIQTAGPRARKGLYLTFDDGPHPEHTPPLLDLLARHGAKATFFLIGEQIDRHSALARRIVDEGHTLGNHSFTHPHFETLPLEAQFDEIERTDRALASVSGRSRYGFRPPRGVLPLPLMLRFIRQRRRIAYWSYDSLDYSRRPAPELVDIIRRHPVRAGDIVLMHDDSTISLEMLESLIPAWKAEGFSLLALPQEG